MKYGIKDMFCEKHLSPEAAFNTTELAREFVTLPESEFFDKRSDGFFEFEYIDAEYRLKKCRKK